MRLRHIMRCPHPECKAKRQFAIIVFFGAMFGGFVTGIVSLL